MPERLTLFQDVDDVGLVEQLDSASTHDVEVFGGGALLHQDLCSAREVLDRRALGEGGPSFRGQSRERRMSLEEVGDLGERLVNRRHRAQR